MGMNKVFILVVLFMLSGCSSKYIGQQLTQKGCAISEGVCSNSFGGLDANYKVSEVNTNNYLIQGNVIWDGSKAFLTKKKENSRPITPQNNMVFLTFALLNNNIIVDVEEVNVNTARTKASPFSFAFNSHKKFDSLVILKYSKRMRRIQRM